MYHKISWKLGSEHANSREKWEFMAEFFGTTHVKTNILSLSEDDMVKYNVVARVWESAQILESFYVGKTGKANGSKRALKGHPWTMLTMSYSIW